MSTLNERIIEARRRIYEGEVTPCIPVDPCDPDRVLADCQTTIASLVTVLDLVDWDEVYAAGDITTILAHIKGWC